MGTTYLSLKQFILALILLTTSVVIYSCKKDRPLTEEEIKNELITDAKDFFEKDILTYSQIIPNDQNYRHGIAKKLLWEKAYIRKISLGNAVVIPIRFNEVFEARTVNTTKYQQVISYLIIYKDIKGAQHAEWVTQIPNNVSGYRNEKFCGTTVVEDWNGNFIKAFAYGLDGQIISVKLTESILYKEISSKRLNCYTIHYYGHNYVEGVAGSDYWYENGSETYCQNESGIDYGPTGGDYGDMGSGGGGDVTESSSPPLEFNILLSGPKINPKLENKCFNISQGAELTIYVQQGKEGTRDLVGPNQVGHVFIGIKQGEIERYYGFYPESGASSAMVAVGKNYTSELRNNSGEMYHVSISKSISSDQLGAIINYANNPPTTYNVNSYACTDFGIAIGKLGGINLPSTKASSWAFEGTSPGNLGEDIKSGTFPNTSKTTNKSNSPSKKGSCN